jgi:hypothetical protein
MIICEQLQRPKKFEQKCEENAPVYRVILDVKTIGNPIFLFSSNIQRIDGRNQIPHIENIDLSSQPFQKFN